MKISELAAASGETIPTLKFYIRKGLLPPGRTVGTNRAEYDEHHQSRLDLIRILKDELGMSLERIGEVIRSESEGGQALLRSGLDAAREARHGTKDNSVDPHFARAYSELLALKERLNWASIDDDPTISDAAESLATVLRVLPNDDPKEYLDGYAQLMKEVADQEIPDDFDPAGKPWEAFKYAILGTYLYEPLILSMRRMAHGQRAFEVEAKQRKTPTAKAPPRARPAARSQNNGRPPGRSRKTAGRDSASKRGRKGG